MDEALTTLERVDRIRSDLSSLPIQLIQESYQWTEAERVWWDRAFSSMNKFRDSVWGVKDE